MEKRKGKTLEQIRKEKLQIKTKKEEKRKEEKAPANKKENGEKVTKLKKMFENLPPHPLQENPKNDDIFPVVGKKLSFGIFDMKKTENLKLSLCLKTQKISKNSENDENLQGVQKKVKKFEEKLKKTLTTPRKKKPPQTPNTTPKRKLSVGKKTTPGVRGGE